MARVVPELLLHWIWQKRLYESQALRTTAGDPVTVLSPGQPAQEGPDFIHAEVRIGGIRWVGAVEIDVTPDKWYAHAHHQRPQYRSVVLHVVWEAASASLTVDSEGREVPILPLSSAVGESQLRDLYLRGEGAFPCAGLARMAPEPLWRDLYEKWAEKRLLARHAVYRGEGELFQAFWEALAYSFGVPQGENFQKIAKTLPVTAFLRYTEGLLDKEAALLGVAGLLEGVTSPVEPYEEMLLGRWSYLQRKHGWRSMALRWAPTRPAASPWIRLARLAALIDSYPRLAHLLERIPDKLPSPSPYWCRHWAWQKPFSHPLRTPSPFLLRNIRINALYPFAIFYLRSTGRVMEALDILEAFRNTPPESHRYAAMYARYAYPARSAWQTQGQIQLWREACKTQRCLDCEMGKYLRQL